MANPTDKAEAALRQLVYRMHLGAAQLHPATEQHLDIVRQIAREQWTQEQQQRVQNPQARPQTRRRKRVRVRRPAKAKLKRATRPARRKKAIKRIPPPVQRYTY